jgi:hypothetical protein
MDELGHDQPKITKELLDIATQHASSEEAFGATFIRHNVKVAASGSQAAPSNATGKRDKKGTKGARKG